MNKTVNQPSEATVSIDTCMTLFTVLSKVVGLQTTILWTLISYFVHFVIDSQSTSQWMTSQGLGTAPESFSSSPAVTAPSPSPWAVLVPLSPGHSPLNRRASPLAWSTGRVKTLRWNRPRCDTSVKWNVCTRYLLSWMAFIDFTICKECFKELFRLTEHGVKL